MADNKPRQVVSDLQGQAQLQPAANPYYLFEYQRPAETEVQRFSGQTPLEHLTNALSEFEPSLAKSTMVGYQAYTKSQEAKALSDFQANRDQWTTAVKNGTVPLGANPHAARAVHRQLLAENADDYYSQTAQAFQGPEGAAARDSNDPAVMRQFLDQQQQKFYAANLKNGDKELYNPLDIQEAYNPKIAQYNAALMRDHAGYRVKAVEQDLKDTVGARISRDVDGTFASITKETPEADRKQALTDLGSRISDTLYHPDYGAVKVGMNTKDAGDLVVDNVIARAMANPEQGRDILDSINYVKRPDGPKLADVSTVKAKVLQAEEHLTSLEIQRDNHNWALEQRPYQRANMQRQPQEFAQQDQRYEQERQRWAEHKTNLDKEATYNTMLRRLYEGMDNPDAQKGTEVVNGVLRDAKQILPEKVEALNQLLHVTHQRNSIVDPSVERDTLANFYLRLQRDPLTFDYGDVVKAAGSNQIGKDSLKSLYDDLERKQSNASHPFMRQPEIHEMLKQVNQGAVKSPGDEFTAQGQMRASQALGAFRDKAAAWIAKNPKGSMPEFTDYMRDQIGPILERVDEDYAKEAKGERAKEENKGQAIVDLTQQQLAQKEQARQDEATKQEQARQAEATKQAVAQDLAKRASEVERLKSANKNTVPTGPLKEYQAPPAQAKSSQAALDRTPDYGFGKREDGTNKGLGYFGMLPRTDDPRQKSSELSFDFETRDGRKIFAPLIVPTLSRAELNSLLGSSSKPSDAIFQKAEDHAMKRIKEGKSPFAQPGEQVAPPTEKPKLTVDHLRTLLTGDQKKEIVALRDRVTKPGIKEKPATEEQLKDRVMEILKPHYKEAGATPMELADGIKEFMRVLLPKP